MTHSDPIEHATPQRVDAAIADIREAIADGSLSGNPLTIYVIDHREQFLCDAAYIAATCPILREEPPE